MVSACRRDFPAIGIYALLILSPCIVGQGMTPAVRSSVAVAAESVVLPTGVTAEWDTGNSYRDTTPTRERICLNGVWRWQFDGSRQMNLKRTPRRVSFLVTRLLANLGVTAATPLLQRFQQPPDPADPTPRWTEGFYLDQPEEWDDPYRFSAGDKLADAGASLKRSPQNASSTRQSAFGPDR